MFAQEEAARVRGAVAAVAEACSTLWPGSHTVLFGSQATSLALPGSDLDIVVLGVAAPLQRAASGFTTCDPNLFALFDGVIAIHPAVATSRVVGTVLLMLS